MIDGMSFPSRALEAMNSPHLRCRRYRRKLATQQSWWGRGGSPLMLKLTLGWRRRTSSILSGRGCLLSWLNWSNIPPLELTRTPRIRTVQVLPSTSETIVTFLWQLSHSWDHTPSLSVLALVN